MSIPYKVNAALRNLRTAEQTVIDQPEITDAIFDEIVGDFGMEDEDSWQENVIAALERQGFIIDHPKWA